MADVARPRRGAPGTPADARPRRRRLAVVLGVVLVSATIVRVFLVAPVAVTGQSMEPTVRDGALAFVGLRSDVADVGRGDLVVFRDPDGNLALKRVIALAGDELVFLDAVLLVNGTAVLEPYVDTRTVDGLFTPLVSVPEGHLFLMGDNRDRSVDSLTYGPVPLSEVIGPVLWTW